MKWEIPPGKLLSRFNQEYNVMDKRIAIRDLLSEQGLLPLFFHPDFETSAGILESLYRAGCRLVEFTNRGPEALQVFTKLRTISGEKFPGMYLGAGTIKNESAANAFMEAGADFLVSPGISEDIFDAAYSEKVMWIPGCMTVTEIMKAEEFGIELVKLFPGSLLGPAFVQAIKEIFPQISFIPTGGVDLDKENLLSWIRAGVAAVGMGSKLISPASMKNREYAKIEKVTREVLASIGELKNPSFH
ncbi:MAG: bifunctional 4-hydroxy-2-oxoglutarate aldolase/2-dehydro-3-deoxy-phosphogluconate aldolase [Bacteroidetes bacterium]|nr:MAG: bifunctional 4-hydroxy-2-oxoglutarate aldolase/2-dehydro-3-deoxy-phosphogluconate aldolase [Bacteroidota bacterium]